MFIIFPRTTAVKSSSHIYKSDFKTRFLLNAQSNKIDGKTIFSSMFFFSTDCWWHVKSKVNINFTYLNNLIYFSSFQFYIVFLRCYLVKRLYIKHSVSEHKILQPACRSIKCWINRGRRTFFKIIGLQ